MTIRRMAERSVGEGWSSRSVGEGWSSSYCRLVTLDEEWTPVDDAVIRVRWEGGRGRGWIYMLSRVGILGDQWPFATRQCRTQHPALMGNNPRFSSMSVWTIFFSFYFFNYYSLFSLLCPSRTPISFIWNISTDCRKFVKLKEASFHLTASS